MFIVNTELMLLQDQLRFHVYSIAIQYWLKIMMFNVFTSRLLNVTSWLHFLKKMLTQVPRYCCENFP